MMHRHIIVSGDDALATTIADELKNAGATVVRLVTGDASEAGVARELTLADVSHALAVVCAGDDDAVNLEIALLARKANPNVRVVSRVANDVLREAVANDNGPVRSSTSPNSPPRRWSKPACLRTPTTSTRPG